MTILVCGNVVDGLYFKGPFNSREEATQYAERNISDEWILANLQRAE